MSTKMTKANLFDLVEIPEIDSVELVVFTKDDEDWLKARDDYYNRFGDNTIVKTISDFRYGISFLLTNGKQSTIICVNDRVETKYKAKRLYKHKEN